MSIYLTQEKKKEIEDKIAELKSEETFGDAYYIVYGTIQTLEQVLLQSVVLPVEESWGDIHEEYVANWCKQHFPNGVIIKKD